MSACTVGDVVLVDGERGVVRFRGTIDEAAGEWVGIEWLRVGRGKHNGQVREGGRRYFACADGMGSMVRVAKVSAGLTMEDALRETYQSGLPDNVEHVNAASTTAALGAADTATASSSAASSSSASHAAASSSAAGAAAAAAAAAAAGAAGSTSVTTAGSSSRPSAGAGRGAIGATKVAGTVRAHGFELVGFAGVAARLADLGQLQRVSLANVRGVGDVTQLGSMLPRVREVVLLDCLLGSWADVADVCTALPGLSVLDISGNVLRAEGVERFAASPKAALTIMRLNAVPATWSLLQSCLGTSAPQLRELHAARCGMRHLRSQDGSDGGSAVASTHAGVFPALAFLNLAENAIDEWSEVERIGELPSLEHLVLSGTPLREVRFRDGLFARVTHLSLAQSALASWASIDELVRFPALWAVKLTGSPLVRDTPPSLARITLIARMPNIRELNGGRVESGERRDAERYYVRRIAAAAANPESMPRFVELCQKHRLTLSEEERAAARAAAERVHQQRTVTVRVQPNSSRCIKAAPIERQVPSTMTVGELRVLVLRAFGLQPSVPCMLSLVEESSAACDYKAATLPVLLDDEMRTLAFYEIGAVADMFLNDMP